MKADGSHLAISYIRWSNPSQADGDSRRRQTAATEDFCRRHKLNLDPTYTYRDAGVSGYLGHNARKGDLAVFLALLKDGRIPTGATLILENLDRLGRDQIMPTTRRIGEILEQGVRIATLDPERIYTQDNANDMAVHLEIVIHVSRAYEESARKSHSCRDAWQEKRRVAAAGGEKMTKTCPPWLALRKDRQGYDLVKANVATVKRIYDMALEGTGTPTIVKTLNTEGLPSFGGKTWRSAYIIKLLKDRSVLGEMQAGVWAGRKKSIIGDPVPGYYPAIIDDDTFARVQLAMRKRYIPRGRTEKWRVNLFKGLLVEAESRSPMGPQSYCSGGRQRVRLVVRKQADGGTGIAGKTFLYDKFENAFLRFVTELKPEDFAAKSKEAEELATVSSQLALVNMRVEAVEADIRATTDKDDMPVLLKMLKDLNREREQVKRKLDEVKLKASNPTVETLADAQTLVGMLAEAKDKDALRMKIRARIRQLVREIYVLIKTDEETHARYAFVQAFFHDDTVRWFVCSYGLTRTVGETFEVPGSRVPVGMTADLRTY